MTGVQTCALPIYDTTGEIYVEAGDEITEEVLEVFDNAKIDKISTLAIDHVNIGPYIRNTLAVDKNSTREEALIDIYRVMRPGEPPTLETAEALFNTLFFDSERYDLSAVGRVKMNSRLNFQTEDSVRTLRKQDILEVVRRSEEHTSELQSQAYLVCCLLLENKHTTH